MGAVQDVLAAIEASGVGQAMRGAAWLYPAVQVAHLAGMATLVGPVLLLDLRLLGVGRSLPLPEVARALLRCAAVGLAVVLPSGGLLFAAQATALPANPAFQAKLALLALAAANAAAFHAGAGRGMAAWGAGQGAPVAARVAACVSLACWLGVVACGRLIAYL
jgi:hypothetical protein